MDVYLTTLGCRTNEAELESWTHGFRVAGHRIVSTPTEAQIIVVNTCAVTNEAVRKSRKLMRRLWRENPEAHFVLTGCYVELEPTEVKNILDLEKLFLVANRDKDRLVNLADEAWNLSGIDSNSAVLSKGSRTRAFVKVQDGCRNKCAFCVVSVARGSERSRAIHTVVDDVNELCNAGYKEVVLCGVHLGGYGNDLGTDLFALVAEIIKKTKIPRIRLSSLEPWDLPLEFWELWQDKRLCPHLHLPLQSGCDAVLQRMFRRCTTKQYEDIVTEARSAIEGLTITTDIIVGFPGETDDEWNATLDFVRKIGFSHIHCFVFSARKEATAFGFGLRIPDGVKKERSQQLHDIANQMKEEQLRAWIGRERPVLWEGRPKRCSNTSRSVVRWRGLTDNYLRTETFVSTNSELENRIQLVHLVSVENGILRAELPNN
ncbi:MAG: tRNA (N(6)-L-threonylcarbamoyladenosine(37)-C(2))-methylthiotransferase MtaB [Pseudomonadota bacterium]